MARTCVFCGKPPAGNRPEHVIPDWILRWTKHPKDAQFSLWQWTVPCCSGCNAEHSDLETKVSDIMRRMRGSQPLGQDDLVLLMDWFDVVRVKAWLWALQFDKEHHSIEPRFQATSRRGLADRLLYVGVAQIFQKRVQCGPIRDAFFHCFPTFFMLEVNGLHFVNLSTHGIAARTLHFPYYVTTEELDDGSTVLERRVVPDTTPWLPAPRNEMSVCIEPIWPNAEVPDMVRKAQPEWIHPTLPRGRVYCILGGKNRHECTPRVERDTIFPLTHKDSPRGAMWAWNTLLSGRREMANWICDPPKSRPIPREGFRLLQKDDLKRLAETGNSGLPPTKNSMPFINDSQGLVFASPSMVVTHKTHRLWSAAWSNSQNRLVIK